MIFKTYYGWEENGKFYLSVFPADRPNRPRNEYTSKEDAEKEAKQRGGTIKWSLT